MPMEPYNQSGLPRFAELLISRLCKAELQEEILGNLEEAYHAHGRKIRLWRECLLYLRPSCLKSINSSIHHPMFIFNPLLTIRNLRKQGMNTIINIAGFTIGLLCVFFLYFYVSSELKYDTFHKDYHEIYRVLRTAEMNGSPFKIGVTSGPYARALETDFEGKIHTCRASLETSLVKYKDKQFFEEHILFADPDFFTFFSFPLASGDPKDVLSQANNVVFSKALAKKYFGDEDPIGQIIETEGEQFIVTGIMDEIPTKSHLEFNMVLSFAFLDKYEWMSNWWNNGLTTYAKFSSPQDRAYVESQLQWFMEKYMGDDFDQTKSRMGLTLEPLSETYFASDVRYDLARHGDLKSVYILAMVAVAILFIACFNYVNMSVALSFKRAKEVGVRKIMGGRKGRLILQFLGESLMVILTAIVLAGLLSQLFLPIFNGLFGLEVTYDWSDPNILLFMCALVGLVVLSSGVYPAVLLSSFKPLRVMKGEMVKGTKGVLIRKGLVVAQFVIAIFLMAVTFLVTIQISYMKNKELGFNQESIVTIDLNNGDIREQVDTFKERLLSHPAIESVAAVSGEPGGFHDGATIQFKGIDEQLKIRTLFTDYDFLETLNIQLLAGRNFDRSFGADMNGSVLLNRKALEELGMSAEEALDKTVNMPLWDEYDRKIVGIVEDYHFQSLKNPIEPLCIILGGRARKIVVAMQAGNLNQGIEHMNNTWEELIDGFPMHYTFLDESLSRLYENEQKQHRVFTSFSIISLFLATLGIFGLVTYSAQRRQKEFGIRKVLGASVSEILSLISKEFTFLIIVAFMVSIPLAWLFVTNWLQAFSYRIVLQDYWYVFAASGIVSLVVALLTIGFRSLSVALSNPSESIRCE
ncbi:ABC transporter permease [Marinoscillum sp.]|uniref:ABC transporter permease n=1 Tax=Marinoscillum sp. TaxID=2024838 RepID=UPI003BA9B0CF